MEARDNMEQIISALESEGLTVKEWEGNETRYYVRQGRKDLGYLVDGDDGSTGTCKGITARQGYIAGIVRTAVA